MTSTTASRFVVKGVNDEENTCMCCGRTGLKRVVWIEDTETLIVRHFGTTCAENPAKAFGLNAEIRKAVREWVAAQEKALHEARNAAVLAACRKASETFPGEFVQGKFGPMPADSNAFEAYKQQMIGEALAAFA